MKGKSVIIDVIYEERERLLELVAFYKTKKEERYVKMLEDVQDSLEVAEFLIKKYEEEFK